MCALSRPVRRHCWMNMPCDRFMIRPVSSIASGTVTSATSASVGEIQNIIASTPTTVSSEVSSWLIVCCSVWLTLSMSLVTRRQQLAARLLVEVAQRQPVDLLLDVGAHPPHGALHDVVEQVALQPGQQRRGDVDARAPSSSTCATASKSTPWPGTTSMPRDHVGELVRRRGRAEPGDRLGLGDARRAAAGRTARRRPGRWPRRGSWGPSDASPTLTTASSTTRERPCHRSGRIRRPAARADGPKSMRLLADHAAAERAPRPGRGPWTTRSVSFSCRVGWLASRLGVGASCHLLAVSWDRTISW